MDRFVWFVLLIVTSHLVTEFTRVTGYARGNRNELVLINDTLIEPKSIQNMLLYPGQQEYGLYEAASQPHYYQGGNNINNNPPAYNNINSIQQQQQQQQLIQQLQQQLQQQQQQQHQKPNGQMNIGPGNGSGSSSSSTSSSVQLFPGFTFSFRPLIDSIFEIPISTLRAVNDLVARLTGSFPTHPPQRTGTTSGIIDVGRSNNDVQGSSSSSNEALANKLRNRQSSLREAIE